MASGHWAGSTRLARLPADWPVIRRRILDRDHHRCQAVEHDVQCISSATDVDHIIPNDDDSDSNLASLCTYHHGLKSAAEGGQASAARRAKLKRPSAPHPGAI